MTTRAQFLAFVAWVLLAPTVRAAGAPPAEAPPLQLHRVLEGESSPTWPEFQFVQADSKGRVFILRGQPLSVYRVKSTEVLDRPVQFETIGEGPAPAARATMSASGGAWLVRSQRTPELFLFRSGKQVQVPSCDWRVTSVGFAGETPLVGVNPALVRKPGPAFERPATPPLLLELAGDSWRPFASEPFSDEEEVDRQTYMFWRSALVHSPKSGKVWLAREYRDRVERWSPGGRLLDEFTIGAGRPAALPEARLAAANHEMQERVKALGLRPDAKVYVVATARVFQALAEGPDGKLYLFVSPEILDGQVALDRIDPVGRTWERLRVAVANADDIATMAAGSDGLFLAASRGDRGRFFVSWPELEAARWERRKEFRPAN